MRVLLLLSGALRGFEHCPPMERLLSCGSCEIFTDVVTYTHSDPASPIMLGRLSAGVYSSVHTSPVDSWEPLDQEHLRQRFGATHFDFHSPPPENSSHYSNSSRFSRLFMAGRTFNPVRLVSQWRLRAEAIGRIAAHLNIDVVVLTRPDLCITHGNKSISLSLDGRGTPVLTLPGANKAVAAHGSLVRLESNKSIVVLSSTRPGEYTPDDVLFIGLPAAIRRLAPFPEFLTNVPGGFISDPTPEAALKHYLRLQGITPIYVASRANLGIILSKSKSSPMPNSSASLLPGVVATRV